MGVERATTRETTRAITRAIAAPASGGAAQPAAFTAPASRSVLTVSVATTVTVYAPSDASLTFNVDGASQGAMTSLGSGNFSFAWTPGAIAASVSLTVTGNVSGVSSAIIVTVDAANTVNQTMTAWTQSATATTVAGSVTPPVTGATVYLVKPAASGGPTRRLFFTSPTGAGTINQDGFEIWCGILPGSVTTTIGYSNGTTNAKIDLANDWTSAGNMYVNVVETKTVNGIVWKRVQFVRLDGSTTAGTSCFFDIHNDFIGYLSADTYTLQAGDLAGSGMYFCLPRRVDDVKLPFSYDMKYTAYKNVTDSAALGVTNAEQWYYKSRDVDVEMSHMAGGPGGNNLRMVKPSGWSATGNHPVLVILKALTDSAESGASNKTAWETATIDDYANTYNAVVVVVSEHASEGYWSGFLTGATKNMKDFYPLVLMPWLIRYHGVSSARKDHLILGYSKGGWSAVQQILEYPTIWGVAGAWDGPWLNAYPSNNASINFSNSTDYNAHDPAQILNTYLTSVNDKKRLVIKGGHTWTADYTSFTAQLTSAGVQYTSGFSDPGLHAWGPTGTNGSWTPTLVADMFTLRASL